MRVSTALLALGATLPGIAAAQGGLDGRVGKLESEMRAVQRKVFPGGSGGVLQPDITAPATPEPLPGTPATSALADLTARVGSLEGQITQLTGQVEQDQFRIRQLQEQFDAWKRDAADRAAAPGAGTGIAPPPAITPPAKAPPEEASDIVATPASAPAGGVARPSTGDAAEDGYLYGYRLWQAKRYDEAATELKKVVANHPKSRRASFAQNLLGRAYLDGGKPSLAAMALYDNYKKMPDGERAPDSLYYLGQALVTLKKPGDACKVYEELTDVYGTKISGSLRADVAKARVDARCK